MSFSKKNIPQNYRAAQKFNKTTFKHRLLCFKFGIYAQQDISLDISFVTQNVNNGGRGVNIFLFFLFRSRTIFEEKKYEKTLKCF